MLTLFSALIQVNEDLKTIGALAGLLAVPGLAVLSLLYFGQAREVRRLRDWAGRAPERAAELEQRVSAEAAQRAQASSTAPVTPAAQAATATPGAAPAPPTAPAPPAAGGATARPGAAPPPAPAPATGGNGVAKTAPATAAAAAAAGDKKPDEAAKDDKKPEEAKAEGEDEKAPEEKQAAEGEDKKEEPAKEPVAAAAGPPTVASPAATPAPAAGAGAAAAATAAARSRPAAPPVPPRPAQPVRAATSSATIPPRGGGPRRGTGGAGEPERSRVSRGGLLAIGAAVLVLAIAVAIVLQVTGGDDNPAPAPNTVAGSASEQPASGDQSAAPAVSRAQRAQTNVAVLNGTTITGLARSVASRLQDQGYTVGNVTDAPNQAQPQTKVEYGSGHGEEARALATAIKVPANRVVSLSAVDSTTAGPNAEVVVVVGQDSAR